jgi:menaquinone-dependent protoporphyrinogen oxidase
MLKKARLEVRVANVNQEKINSISEYDLVLVGSGIEIGKLQKKVEAILKEYKKEVASKKLALFVSCGASSVALNDGKPEEMAQNKEAYLNEEATKFGLKPLTLGFFGGIYDYNKMPWIVKLILRRPITPKVKSAFKESSPGVYDTRDMNEIKSWAENLSKIIMQH